MPLAYPHFTPPAQPFSRPRHDQVLVPSVFFAVFIRGWTPCRGHDSIPTRNPKRISPPPLTGAPGLAPCHTAPGHRIARRTILPDLHCPSNPDGTPGS